MPVVSDLQRLQTPEREMFPIDYHIEICGPQLVALFGEVVEPLGGGALQEDVCHWGKGHESLLTCLIYSLKSLLSACS